MFVIVGLVVIFGGWLVVDKTLLNKEGDDQMQEQTQNVPADATPTEQETTTLRALMAQGDVMCTFTQVLSAELQSNVVGTMYISDGRVRGDFLTSADDESFATSLIYIDDTTYVWGTTPFGDQAFMIRNSSAQPEGNGMDMDQELPYVCGPWAVDAAMFVPPTDIVDFQELEPEPEAI